MNYTRNIVILSGSAALILWAADAMVDAFLFHQGNGTSPIALLVGASPHDLYSRLFMIAGLFLYGALLTKTVFKRDQAHEVLRESIVVNDRLRKEIRDRMRTEGELRRSENFLGTIFNSIHDPFSIVDRDYTIMKVNDSYAHMYGRPAKDLLGKTCYEALHGRTSVCEECVVEKTFRSSDPYAKEKLVTTPDSSELWMEIYTYPVFNENMRVSHVIEYARNITDRKMGRGEETPDKKTEPPLDD